MSMSPYLGIYEGSIILGQKGEIFIPTSFIQRACDSGRKKKKGWGGMKSTKKICKKQRESGSTLNILIKSSKHKNVT